MRFHELLKKQFVVARVAEIPVRADLRLFFVILAVALAIWAGIAPIVGNAVAGLVLGLLTAVVFFVSIFIHEFAHAIAARFESVKVAEIVLHPFGGFTRFLAEPETPRSEFTIAAAGPAASIVLAAAFVFAAIPALRIEADILGILLITLAVGNLLLAGFNLLPGYPLDGGRVLRAYLRRNGRDTNEATLLTARFGQIIAIVMIVAGTIFSLLRGDLFAGIWAILVGVFLFDSARTLISDLGRIADIKAGDVMMLPIPVSPDATIQRFVDDVLPAYPQTAFPVSSERQLYGILLLADIKAYPREDWTRTTVREVMKPISAELFVDIETPMSEAADLLRTNGAGALGIVDAAGLLVGFINAKKRM